MFSADKSPPALKITPSTSLPIEHKKAGSPGPQSDSQSGEQNIILNDTMSEQAQPQLSTSQEAEEQEIATHETDALGELLQSFLTEAVPATETQTSHARLSTDTLSTTEFNEKPGKKMQGETRPENEAGQTPFQETTHGYTSKTCPEQIRLFDVHFDWRTMKYNTIRLQKDKYDWHDLKCEPDFTLNDEKFRRGDLVHIELCDPTKSDVAHDVAFIEDIRAIAGPDERKLAMISWVYLHDGRHYRSNHLQIVLWDTVSGRASKMLMQRIRPDQLYNACGGRRLCSPKQARIWHERKLQILRMNVEK